MTAKKQEEGRDVEVHNSSEEHHPTVAHTRNADGTLIPPDSGLTRVSTLYQQIKTLDKVAIKLSVTKRVKLAAMARYRTGLLQKDAGRKQAKAANLHLLFFCL